MILLLLGNTRHDVNLPSSEIGNSVRGQLDLNSPSKYVLYGILLGNTETDLNFPASEIGTSVRRQLDLNLPNKYVLYGVLLLC